MNYIIAAQTDVGTVKDTNQDSLMVKSLSTNLGNIVFAVLCDGMGGLAKGELASATVIRAFEQWADNDLRMICETANAPIIDSVIKEQWEQIIENENNRIKKYGESIGVNLGTTVVAILITEQRYYLMNVGDSRAYLIDDNLIQLTKDQTFVGREIELGHMTVEQAMVDSRRNVLLQCVGASEVVYPDMFFGEVKAETEFLLCSDGFRHEITADEIFDAIKTVKMHNSDIMNEKLRSLISLNMQRGERDNITAALIKVRGNENA